MHALLKARGMELSTFCLVCRLENKYTEHTLLCYQDHGE